MKPPAERVRHPWWMALFALLAALALAHAPGFRDVWTGESAWTLGIDRCAKSLALREEAGGARAAIEESCDTIGAQREGWEVWRRAGEAWTARKSTVHFLVRDIWGLTTTSGTVNHLDRMVLMWPTRLLFGPSGGLAALHLGLLALGAVSGLVLARALRCTPLAGAAAGLVIGGSGLVMESTLRGEYPQAVLLGYCLFFGGLVRVIRRERFGLFLFATGLAFSALIDWTSGVILGLGGLAFFVASGGRLDGARSILIGVIVAAILCLPAAVPVFETLGGRWSVGWGTPLPSAPSTVDLVDLIDEVPWFTLLDPRLGWLPALPLLPFMVGGVRHRPAWLVVAAFGIVLALGPWPIAPWGARVFEGHSALPRTDNPVYAFVYRWFPLASHVHHPVRWAGLATVSLAAATAFGVDAAHTRWPRVAIAGVLSGILWTTWIGPWPMPVSPFPQDVVEALGDCKGLVLPADPADAHARDDIHRLEGLLWVPRAPLTDASATKEMGRWSELRMRGLRDAIDGAPLHGPDPLAGMCILYESRWVGRDTQNTRETLVATFGQPTRVIVPSALFAVDGTTRRIEVFAGGRKPTP